MSIHQLKIDFSMYLSNIKHLLIAFLLLLSIVSSQAIALSIVKARIIQTIHTAYFNPASPDPAAITYLNSSDTLLIGDSEVNEAPYFGLDNLFELSLQGHLLNTTTVLPTQGGFSYEPTGLSAINPANQHLFISDDDQHKLFELDLGWDGQYGTFDDQLVQTIDTRHFGCIDPEGVAFNPHANQLYVACGRSAEVYIIAPGSNGLFGDSDDTLTQFDTLSLGLRDPEGIAYDPASDHLFIIGEPNHLVFELTTQGAVVQAIDISAALTSGIFQTPAGLTFAPDSQGSINQHLYITDRGLDNNPNPARSNDGKIYEIDFPVAEDTSRIDRAFISSNNTLITEANNMTSIDIRVAADSDDAEEKADGRVNLSSSDLELILDGDPQSVGLRFTGLNIPQGVAIQNAWIQFQTDEPNASDAHLNIHGQAIDHALAFSLNNGNISSRSTTVASVDWTPVSWMQVGEQGANQRTPDIAPVIQEIIDRPGWSAGNGLVVIITGTGQRTAESFDGNAHAAPLLHIDF